MQKHSYPLFQDNAQLRNDMYMQKLTKKMDFFLPTPKCLELTDFISFIFQYYAHFTGNSYFSFTLISNSFLARGNILSKDTFTSPLFHSPPLVYFIEFYPDLSICEVLFWHLSVLGGWPQSKIALQDKLKWLPIYLSYRYLRQRNLPLQKRPFHKANISCFHRRSSFRI